MLSGTSWAGGEVVTGYVLNNNFAPPGPPEPKAPGMGMNADPAETALALMRDFFNTRPKRVLLSCLEDMDQDNSGMISFGEFERALKALNFDLSEKLAYPGS